MQTFRLLPLSLLFASSTVFANSTQVYIEQNVASNAADDGTYATEAGALIETSENGQVFIGMDDQGWLAAGYGHNFSLSDDLGLTLYGEVGKWETGEELLVEAIVDYQINESINVFTGLGYNISGQVIEKLSDTAINTNKFIAGTNMSIAGFDLNYTYTHANSDGTNGYIHIDNSAYFSQGDYRTNEHEIVLSKQIDNWTPYLKYTYFNTHEGSLTATGQGENSASTLINSPVDNDSIWTLGVSYQF
ncbi:hypothetical protein F0231_10715 [Vibrio sp. RE86]|uniref:hypothetical protein n=1 Tax=Vibrio sp. RE86 TaxID=2607605 RepID=UPI0014932999|nr:hypothetical protein [Vibrio sp. RE86]NOH80206.1 hypothetical protein [Vibrio sp. RE86]